MSEKKRIFKYGFTFILKSILKFMEVTIRESCAIANNKTDFICYHKPLLTHWNLSEFLENLINFKLDREGNGKYNIQDFIRNHLL